MRKGNTKTQVKIYKDAVEVRSYNRRFVVQKHKRMRGGVALYMYSVNRDYVPESKGHVSSSCRLGRNFTAMGLSFEALREISLAIELYSTHIEPISEQTWVYQPLNNQQ